MIKKIVVSLSLLFSLTSLAQEGTSSPYSFYGIGDIKFKGTVDTRSMGGLTVFPDSIHLNLQNPAHLSSLKLTSFAIGGTYANTKFQSETADGKARRTTLDYLAVGIPVGKLGIGFGLIPYSSIGYKIQTLTDEDNPTFSRYSGVGGVNKVFAGAGYKITKELNVGASIQYNFGTIETTNLRYLESVQYGTRENNFSDLQGFNLDFGLSYQRKLTKKLSLFSSVTYSPESKLKLDNSRTIDLIQFLSTGTTSVIQREDIDVANTEIKIPSKWSFGTGIGEMKKWMFGGEVTLINNSVLSNRFNDIDDAVFENSTRYSLGGYFIPNYNSYSGYFKRIVYRAGLRYENTGLVLQNKSITDAAMNVGFGLPLSGTFSNININFEYGKRGTTYYNLVQENYFNISIGLSLSDKWFIKRKFD
jgi:long-subunit fatty acid transport protein